MLANAIQREWKQQLGGKLRRLVAAHELQHDVHGNGVPLASALIPFHLRDFVGGGNILLNETHFLMCNAHKFFNIKSPVVQLMPDFPARTLGGCQVVHHAHGHAINCGGKRYATIAAEPVGEILQRLENVVANFARIIVGDELGLLFVGHQQRARIQRVAWIKASNIGAMNEGQHVDVIFWKQKRLDQVVQRGMIRILKSLPRFHKG